MERQKEREKKERQKKEDKQKNLMTERQKVNQRCPSFSRFFPSTFYQKKTYF
jgi:hypothetical protein